MEKVSAIITTHDRSKLLERAIKSVFNQTYTNIECIVVDDASTDNTKEVCQKYSLQYIYIPKEESHGGNYARNIGIKASKGKYCAFLDDDDYWLPQKIKKQVKLIEEKDCELVYCGMKIEQVEKTGVIFEDKTPSPKACGDMSKKILLFIATNTSTILVKRDALLEVGLFDENLKFWQEYDLCIRMAQRKPFFYVNEPLIVYRLNQRDTNRLTNKYWEWRNAVDYIHQKYEPLYGQLSPYERYLVKHMVWEDSVQRCKSSGLWGRFVYYKILTFPINTAILIKHFLRFLKII